MFKPKRTCTTKLVVEALKRKDDFMTQKELREATGEEVKRVSAAIHNLLRYKAIGAMEVEGKLWFYLTEENDERMFPRDEMKDGITRKRKPKKLPPAETASGTNNTENNQ